jgi:hypothetical protein
MMSGQSAALQVSLPGFNVETTTLNNMAFDARFANMHVFLKTQVSFGEIVGRNDVLQQTIFYPETLPQPPLCLVRIQQTAGTGGAPPPNGSSFLYIDQRDTSTIGFCGFVGRSSMTLHVEGANHKRPNDNVVFPTIWTILLLRP